MKAKDTVALTTLRALKTALTNAAGVGNKQQGEADALAIVRKQIKQRQDSIEQFEKADRPELAQSEKAEIVVLERYLPAALWRKRPLSLKPLNRYLPSRYGQGHECCSGQGGRPC